MYVFAIIVALIYKISPNRFCSIFVQGASQVLAAALAIGMAQSVMVLLNQGQIMDTLVYYMGNALARKEHSGNAAPHLPVCYGI